jgi:hypothetical protein
MITANNVWLKREFERDNIYHCSRERLGPLTGR